MNVLALIIRNFNIINWLFYRETWANMNRRLIKSNSQRRQDESQRILCGLGIRENVLNAVRYLTTKITDQLSALFVCLFWYLET